MFQLGQLSGWRQSLDVEKDDILGLRYGELVRSVCFQMSEHFFSVGNILPAGLTFVGCVAIEGAPETLMNKSSLKMQWKCPVLSSIMDNDFAVQWKLISMPRFCSYHIIGAIISHTEGDIIKYQPL